VARREEPPVPGLLDRREPRVLGGGAADRRAAPERGGRPGGSFYGSRLRWAGWITWALAAFAVVLTVVWQRPEPLGATALWGLAGVGCRRAARLVEGPLGPARALGLLGLVLALLVLLIVGAGLVARGEHA
jgi:drug/metabolite transporter (DMT)-like permease